MTSEHIYLCYMPCKLPVYNHYSNPILTVIIKKERLNEELISNPDEKVQSTPFHFIPSFQDHLINLCHLYFVFKIKEENDPYNQPSKTHRIDWSN